LAGAPPGAVIIGLCIAPNGLRAAALTLLPSADYLMDDLFHDADGHWQPGEGGSGGQGINWSGGDLGVVRFSGEAPVDARYAVVRYDGRGASRFEEERSQGAFVNARAGEATEFVKNSGPTQRC